MCEEPYYQVHDLLRGFLSSASGKVTAFQESSSRAHLSPAGLYRRGRPSLGLGVADQKGPEKPAVGKISSKAEESFLGKTETFGGLGSV